MENKAIEILNENRIMAIATNRPDGWPQATMVGFANEDLLIYFMISRGSQKFENINCDDRVSLVVGRDFHDPSTIKALSIAARASEVRDEKQRKRALKMLLARHPGLQRLAPPAQDHSALMRAKVELVTVLDYSKGFGHTDVFTVGAANIAEMTTRRDDDWGYGTAIKPTS